MTRNDATLWMWAEACDMLEQAERLQRQFFTLGPAGSLTTWEPPVDVYEDGDHFEIVIALPGVPPDCIDVVVEPGSVLVRARCEIRVRSRAAVVQRMEIPHGRFERRIALPDRPLELAPPRSAHGLLILHLRKRD